MKYKNNEFCNIIKDILSNEIVQSLHTFTHHYGSTRFSHSLSVSYLSYKTCKFLHLDYISAARAGLLHDLFLYDCKSSKYKPKFHIWKHPKIALNNATKLFELNKKEKDIILKHMWPITFNPPRFSESFIVSFIDKYCSVREWINYSKYVIWIWYLSWIYTNP